MNESEPEVIERVLRENGFDKVLADYVFSLYRSYRKRLIITQWQEDDLAFITRLCRRIGIWFVCETGKHCETVRFGDDFTHYVHDRERLTVPYQEPNGLHTVGRESVQSLTMKTKTVPTKFTVRSYSPEQPNNLRMDGTKAIRDDRTTYGEAYTWGRDLDDEHDAAREALLRQEAALAEQIVYTGECDLLDMAPSCVLMLSNRALPEVKHGLLVVSMKCSASLKQGYKVAFTAIPSDRIYRMPLKEETWPRIQGVVTGKVASTQGYVGPYLDIADELPLIVPLYYPGVGTPLDASDPGWWEKVRDSEMLGGGAGAGSDVRLDKAEKEFSENLKYNHKVSRIDIAVFGFSRGATLARAFVNRLLKKCTMKDGVPHWPCPTAVDGESAPLHFRFLGVFDTVESVGLPAHNLSDLRLQVPEQVERCLHFVSGHELRACFPLTPVRGSTAFYEEIALPGVHSDIGGGYRPEEQARSDLLARIALNRMRLDAAISGVPFVAPKLASKEINALFEYDEDVKALFDEYMRTVNATGTLEQQIFAHMRLYYGWLKVRFNQRPADIYKNVRSAAPQQSSPVQRRRAMPAQRGHRRLRFPGRDGYGKPSVQ